MVHLSSVAAKLAVGDREAKAHGEHDGDRDGHVAKQMPGTSDFADELTLSVYGSRFAAQTLPRDEMPEGEMPREVAYRLIKDDLSLDGNPRLNLASFVTTYMEEEAEKLMAESLAKNFIDYEEYPQTADIQSRCVNMIGDLFHAPRGAAIGTSTVGSSEAIMLAVLAMKRRWKQRRQAAGLPTDKPNIVMNAAVQVCWEKAARYFEVDERLVYCSAGSSPADDRFVADPDETVALCDENTIGICAILGTTYTGEYEDVKRMSDILVEKDMDVPIHVDAASGGFVAPFVVPDLEWDFRCEKVVSINVSGHKYGLVYPGVGWVVWRDTEYLPQDLVFNVNYLGANQSSFTLNFSKGASQIIGQYYQLIRLGRRGYRSIMGNLTTTADYLARALEAEGFIIMSKRAGAGLPLVAFRFTEDEDRAYDEFSLARSLRGKGWIVPAYTMAPKANHLKMLRVVVREDFTKSMCDLLLHDIKYCLNSLAEMDKETLAKHEKYMQKHVAAHGKRRTKHQHHTKAYHNEEHSLQGKTGKTHGVC